MADLALPHRSVPNLPVPPTASARPSLPHTLADSATRVLPGLLLCAAVTLAAMALQAAEEVMFGRAWLEALVLAILIGTAVRTAWTPGARWHAGVAFAAKTLLEVAVVLLGASLSLGTIMAAGPGLLAGIAGVVAVAILLSYGIGRALRLPRRMAVLVACGNSICGNSAIAAVAPVIGADSEDVASSIAFTAVLGVIVVLALPLLVPLLHMTGLQYGVLAGLTVYAVPQVLAATAPIGAVAVQIGTLVKLVRVLMLAPVVLCLSLVASRLREEADEPQPHLTAGDRPMPGRIAVHHLVPWFILGFLAMAGLRSAGLIPAAALGPVGSVATVLTVLSMAALGLRVDVRVVARAGMRVVVAVTASLLVLGIVSLGLIRALGIAG
ncbi:YeiH family protein [Paeniroseomonas aquatica]|uniref:YeiH family protein n=1 Tax=Paeniroseomonas aquatica TaxID=373043 RepID=A0ABT8A891_9PROT|nr:YeiH family protein [Paeniroseomonas aquatica]MDN3566033.1 YeiH family protein [Paeniroseomonas aquatica]